jgi:hypothetical protein
MKLKCIGGPSDGKIIEVPDSYMDVRVPDPVQLVTRPGGPPEEQFTSVGLTVYTRRLLHHVGANQERLTIQYLAPHGISDLDSLRPLLEP